MNKKNAKNVIVQSLKKLDLEMVNKDINVMPAVNIFYQEEV